jgi:hypothetical protein
MKFIPSVAFKQQMAPAQVGVTVSNHSTTFVAIGASGLATAITVPAVPDRTRRLADAQ